MSISAAARLTTILRYEGKCYEVLATYGDTYLGGEDFDFRIVDHPRRGSPTSTTSTRGPIDSRSNDSRSRGADHTEPVPHEVDISPPATGGKDLQDVLTRSTLEELVSDLAFRTIQIAGGTVADAGLKNSEIDEVILVGGQTRMPLVREGLRSLFDREPSQKVNPDQVVAIGAAAHAAKLHDPQLDTSVFIDVIPYAMGIEVAAGVFQPIFGKYERVPCQQTKSFRQLKDNRETIAFVVRQGNSMNPRRTVPRAVHRAGFRLAPHGRAGRSDVPPRRERANVTAKDKATGKELTVRGNGTTRSARRRCAGCRGASRQPATRQSRARSPSRERCDAPEIAKTEPMHRNPRGAGSCRIADGRARSPKARATA